MLLCLVKDWIETNRIFPTMIFVIWWISLFVSRQINPFDNHSFSLPYKATELHLSSRRVNYVDRFLLHIRVLCAAPTHDWLKLTWGFTCKGRCLPVPNLILKKAIQCLCYTRQSSTHIYCDLGFICNVLKCKCWGCSWNCDTPEERKVGLLLEVWSFTAAPPPWVNLLPFLMTLQHFDCCCHFFSAACFLHTSEAKWWVALTKDLAVLTCTVPVHNFLVICVPHRTCIVEMMKL